jgi:hypothetical protein
MHKLQLTEKQASFLIEMLVNHAEWADPLDQEDRILYAVIQEASEAMPKVFQHVTRLKQEERKREAEEHRKRREAEEAGN